MRWGLTRPVLISKAGRIGKYGKNWLLNPETGSQSEGYSCKWLIWLVCREPLLGIRPSWAKFTKLYINAVRTLCIMASHHKNDGIITEQALLHVNSYVCRLLALLVMLNLHGVVWWIPSHRNMVPTDANWFDFEGLPLSWLLHLPFVCCIHVSMPWLNSYTYMYM